MQPINGLGPVNACEGHKRETNHAVLEHAKWKQEVMGSHVSIEHLQQEIIYFSPQN
jgi:hypothetical protein